MDDEISVFNFLNFFVGSRKSKLSVLLMKDIRHSLSFFFSSASLVLSPNGILA